MGKALGFDLGSAYTAFCIQEEKELRTIPSVIATDKKTQRIVAVGNDAKKMIGRTPSTVTVSKPIVNGLVGDISSTAILISEILERLEIASVFKRAEIVATIPFGAGKNDEHALEAAITDAGISTIDFVETPLAIALGAGMPLDIATGRLIVDIGAGHADASVISHGGVVISSAVKSAGNAMTEAIVKYIAEVHGIEIGELTAEAIKVKLGTLNPSAPQKSLKISGKACADKNTSKITSSAIITSHELIPVLATLTDKIIETIMSALENTPPEISSDISDFGILLSGGGAAINGMAGYIEKSLKVKVTTTKAPALDAIRGVLRIINGGRAYAKFTK